MVFVSNDSIDKSAPSPENITAKSRNKFLIISAVVVVSWLGLSAVTGPLFGKLTSVQKNDNSNFLPASAESTKVAKFSVQFSGQKDSSILPALVIFSGQADPTNVAKVAKFVGTVSAMPIADSGGKTIGDYLAANSKLIPIPSKDGKAVIVSIPMDNKKLAVPLSNNKPALGAVVKEIRAAAGAVPAFESHVTGIGGILADLFDSFGSLDTTLLGTTLAVVALILILVYRSPVLWIIPLFGSITALSLAGGLVYLLAKNGAITLDGQSQGILSVLTIGAGTDYALLMIARYREELHHYDSRVVAMKKAWRGVVEPIVASGLTVIFALMVLSLSLLKSVRSLGPVAALGIFSAQVVILTFLPAALVLIPRGIFWPKVPRHDDEDERLSGVWSKVAGAVGRKPRRTWLATGLLLIVATAFAGQISGGGLAQTDAFTGKPDSVIGLAKLSEHFPGGAGDPTLVIVPAADVKKVTTALLATDGVATVTPTQDQAAIAKFYKDNFPSLVGLKKGSIPKVIDGKQQLEVTLKLAADSKAAKALIPAIRDAVHTVSPTALVGGSTATNYDISAAEARDIRVIVPIALLVIGIILAFLLRSLVAPVMLVLTTVLSFGATLGICHLIFKYLFHFKGTDGAFPLYAFVFLVALGIDYNIFLMTRVREEAAKIGTRPGIIKGVTVTGGVITSAGIVLAATFAVLATLPLVILAEIGFAVAFGVLLDTIVVRSLLVPALAYEMNHLTWWPSKLAKPESVELESSAAAEGVNA
jgi:RND superfamily putative drug exporter